MKKPIYLLLAVYALICTLTILFFDGTGDVGDSIAHYLFARYAPAHPALYFDHWAKPLYVLLASPFAQFGFAGVKLFNVINTLLTIFITYNIAVKLQLKNALLCAVMMMCAPLYYILTFSGLTEPLFALFTALGIYFCVSRNYIAACLIVSFLPYVRSEGLIICGVFGLYLLYIKHLKITPLLITGSVVYAIAGYFVYHDFLWVFTRIPYATLGSVYGSGGLFHFVEQLINVVGVPVYILFWIGLLASIAGFIKKEKGPEEGILVVLGFLCFFIAHTLFWYLGIFNSMGLKRVLLGVMPMIAIIALNGFNLITDVFFKNKTTLRRAIAGVFIAYIVVFPFTPNPAAIHWKKDLMTTEEQTLAYETVNAALAQTKIQYPVIYNHHYLSMVLKLDHFDDSKRKPLDAANVAALKPGGLIIWENKFASHEADLSREALDNDTTLVRAYTCKGNDYGEEIIYTAYIKK